MKNLEDCPINQIKFETVSNVHKIRRRPENEGKIVNDKMISLIVDGT
jgi:hypothetical protein